MEPSLDKDQVLGQLAYEIEKERLWQEVLKAVDAYQAHKNIP